MVQAAWQGAEDCDVLLLLHDCARRAVDDDTASILANLAASGRRASLVLNKIDLAPQERLLERAAELSELYDFEISDALRINFLSVLYRSLFIS